MVGIQSAELITLDGVAGTGWEPGAAWQSDAGLDVAVLETNLASCLLHHIWRCEAMLHGTMLRPDLGGSWFGFYLNFGLEMRFK